MTPVKRTSIFAFPLSSIGYAIRFAGVPLVFIGLKHGMAWSIAGGVLILVGTGLRAYGFFGRGGIDSAPSSRR